LYPEEAALGRAPAGAPALCCSSAPCGRGPLSSAGFGAPHFLRDSTAPHDRRTHHVIAAIYFQPDKQRRVVVYVRGSKRRRGFRILAEGLTALPSNPVPLACPRRAEALAGTPGVRSWRSTFVCPLKRFWRWLDPSRSTSIWARGSRPGSPSQGSTAPPRP